MVDESARPLLHSLVNGRELSELSVLDRGLHYADGVFETVAVIGGTPVLWDRHLERLLRGCSRLGIPAPSAQTLHAETTRLAAGHARAVLKWIVTRGVMGRGYRPASTAVANRVGLLYGWPTHPPQARTEGVRVRICSTRLPRAPQLAGIKHLARLEQVLASMEWNEPAIAEGLMLDVDDCVIEGTMSNVFLVRGQRLLTPGLSSCGVAGIMREFVCTQAESLGLETEVCTLNVDDFAEADEVFLTNSVIGLWPVRELSTYVYPAPGPVSRELLTLIKDELAL